MQNARDNPIAAVAAAAAAGAPTTAQNNAENLLDFDMDGAAPASAPTAPTAGSSGLEGLAGTPERVASPGVPSPMGGAGGNNNLDDLMGVFGGDSTAVPNNGMADLANGFGSLGMGDVTQPAPPTEQLGAQKKQNNEDILGLF